MLMPISCVECRRRKVKCNKQVPCNQCLVRNRQCSYPEKFRSIRVDQFIIDAPEDEKADSLSSGLVSPTSGTVKSEPPAIPAKRGPEDDPAIVGDAGNDKDEIIQNLRKDNEALKLKIKELKLKYKRDKLKEYDEDNAAEDSGNSKPAGPMYYGPNSTRFMISRALSNADVGEFDDFINVKRQMKQKRQLPILYQVDPEKAKSMTAKQKTQENISLIRKLVCKFFHLRFHYINYLEQAPLLSFLDNYKNAKTWKDDDDTLLLIIMVLIVVLRSVPASDPLFQEYNITYERTRPLLYKQYRNLKSGIQVETTTSLRAYILECEDLYFNNQIERSWNLLFRIVSAAYSLGLHVYDETIADTLKKENSEAALDIVKKNQRASLWFVINFVSATLCSVLGRPNPVTFTFQPLLRNYEIRLNYKIGLAELVKRSTNILIDSYKVNINFDTIMEIDEAFVSEVLIYEKILADTREVRNYKGRDRSKPSYITLPVIDKKARRKNSFKSLSQLNLSELLNSCPLDIRFTILRPCETEPEEKFCLLDTDCDTLNDLIMLYGNRAKFHQHFMSSYQKSLESCLDSVLKVLEHAQLLVELRNNFFHKPSFHDIYPFFYTFFYQTLVVMYTVMHLGYSKLYMYSDAIGAVRRQLSHLFEIVDLDYWRPNVVRIMQYINEMCDNYFKMHAEVQKQNSSLNLRNSEHKAELGPQSRASGLFQLAMTPIQEDNIPISSNSKIQVHNVPEHLSQDHTRVTNLPGQDSPERVPFYMSNSGNSLSQISLGNYNLDYYDPKQQLFPLPQQTKTTDDQYSGVDQLDSSVTVDPLLGFDLSDPFFIQNPSNFNYSAPVDHEKDSDSDAPLTVRPKNSRFNSNDSNDFTNYLSATHNSRGNSF
ncbi:hypothetical protein KL906_001887 [Ogataea polymorpha]|nr:hypothetical protein KL937_002219 [Ogataea polymorpha]KAG7909982.1 hypothetical protein KL906_001887 [Ogataea polymorpha]KAG7917682.1 hypothetical protein KL927_002425 [Ogataea polymorpha]KAG7934722.1 hypothetical protein KL934_002648 [Ogataea polymorpha]KAG7936089.1 hypothetical protein KL904_002737 [Ogataea polymorpha]